MFFVNSHFVTMKWKHINVKMRKWYWVPSLSCACVKMMYFQKSFSCHFHWHQKKKQLPCSFIKKKKFLNHTCTRVYILVNMRRKIKRNEVNIRNPSLVWQWLSTGTDYPETRYSLHIWRSPESAQMWQPALRIPTWSGLGPHCLQWAHLSHSAVLCGMLRGSVT